MITVVVPTVPYRGQYLKRALSSVSSQTMRATKVIVQRDDDESGAAITRHNGLMKVDTEWVAFLDDDDEFYPHHLKTLYDTAIEHHADYVWSRFHVVHPNGTKRDGPAPLRSNTYEQWNVSNPAATTITTLVKADLAQRVGFIGGEIGRLYSGEDRYFTLKCNDLGATFRHAPITTWMWHHHGGNTSGLSPRQRRQHR